jgi:hypothetical protein
LRYRLMQFLSTWPEAPDRLARLPGHEGVGAGECEQVRQVVSQD